MRFGCVEGRPVLAWAWVRFHRVEKISTPRLAGSPNFRDIGGHPAADGRQVRTGVAFRAGGLDQLTPADHATLLDLGVRRVYDLRTSAERDMQPDVLPEGIAYHVVDAQRSGRPGADIASLFADPAGAQALRSPQNAVAFMNAFYQDNVTSPDGSAAFASVLRALAEPGTLVHCTAGKDRTGWVSAVLLLMLGVSRERVSADYLRSNELLAASFEPIIGLAALGGFPEDIVRPFLEVRAEYLDTALTTMSAEYGDLTGYVREGLGLSEADVDALRTAFLL